MRSSHFKSRTGCRECKQRHRKCDESLPICVNCAIANRSCSYRHSRPNHRLHARSRPCPETTTPPPSHLTILEPLKLRALQTRLPDRYDLIHLELLHHLEWHVFEDKDMFLLPIPACQRIMQCAFSTPYLMDQILALSAAHKGASRAGSHCKFYRNQAIELQTRALTAFNKAGWAVSERNDCSWFLYSSMLGLHMMYDTLQCNDFNLFLGRLSTYLAVHRGVHVVVRHSWPVIQGLVEQIVGAHFNRIGNSPSSDEQPRECDPLISLIEECRLPKRDRDACLRAVESLQTVFDLYRADGSTPTHIHLTISWPITLEARFAEMLGRRRHEALVILAYYAVLLHRSSRFWVFGDSGRFLITSISAYLGQPWAKWLKWPNQQLEAFEALSSNMLIK